MELEDDDLGVLNKPITADDPHELLLAYAAFTVVCHDGAVDLSFTMRCQLVIKG